MRLTLGKAKEALKAKAPAEKLEHRINRLHERLLLHGKFQGSIVRLAMIARFGQLTPPRFIRAVEGIKFCNGIVPQIANRWFDFMPRQRSWWSSSQTGGIGSNCGFGMSLTRDLGDGHAVLYDLPIGGNLRSDVASGTPVLTVYGYDANHRPLIVTLTGNQTVVNPFTVISRVHKEQKTVAITLTHVATDLTETPLAIMEPTEEETWYHRYRIDSQSLVAETSLEALCKLRHIEFTSDQDVLLISNISALELGMDALQFEAENDHTTADKYLIKAVDLLNRELSDTNSDNDIPTIQFRHIGGAPNFNFGY